MPSLPAFAIPEAAFVVSADHVFAPQRRKISSYHARRRGVVDEAELEQSGLLTTPLGGIGTGGMVWDRLGRFSRWSLKTGAITHFCEPACGFAVRWQADGEAAQALALQPAPAGDGIQLAGWSFRDATMLDHSALLFPASWRELSLPAGAPLRLQCRSFSPVVPGDLDTASLPVALFDWEISNTGTETVDCSLMFHWANLNNWFDRLSGGRPERRNMGKFNRAFQAAGTRGVILDRKRIAGASPDEGVGQWAIAMQEDAGVEISLAESFDGLAENGELWASFTENGTLPDCPAWLADGGFRTEESGLPSAGLCARVKLLPGEARSLRFALTWDMPSIRFGYGRTWQRWYTQQWGTAGDQAVALARHALDNADRWLERIASWHRQVAEERGGAPEAAGFALNELYLLVDGGTALTAPSLDQAAQFALLECPDYPYYNTMDLWVYAAESVLRHWPELATLVMDNYAALLVCEDATERKSIFGDKRFVLQRAGAVPHDVGAPEEDPFVQANGYALKDSTVWKDLNSQFVLATYRTGQVAGAAWRQRHYPAIRTAIERLEVFDRDGDGLIENDGVPDQTFDNVPMRGVSAYCAGLWLAALAAGTQMANESGDDVRASQWRERLECGRQSFHKKLWTGTHYRLDECGPFSEALFLEQLFGPYLARTYGLGDLVKPEHAVIALKTLFDRSFLAAGCGLGPRLMINASAAGMQEMAAHGDTEVQVTEVIIGIAMSFIAQCRCWGLKAEADQVQRALYLELYPRRGLYFRTPAAIEIERQVYRAPLNLRPLAIWLG